MPSLEEIQSQISCFSNANTFMTKKEIKELPHMLWEDEKIEKITNGAYNNGIGILVATNSRLIFIDKGFIKLRVENFDYSKISSIEYETGILMGEITIYTSGNRAKITHMEKSMAREMAEFLRAYIANNGSKKEAPKETTEPKQSSGGIDSQIERLEKLSKLLEGGFLTQEEFDIQKKKIISEI
ncbi:PH domain-containing protein [Campylobacter sp. RM9344]|uniref:PH domain-containing protein n=1 Tax=Campylobacter californiensis TaxID=1032243 RepID=A0AAW3ZWN4_9BACT|nr:MULTISPECIES: PH domain-containing protein [unclassified Campylobacter]MBE2984659.1 PH domain-containing protein [Campylobacter sp. RM6883]MBE2994575.1 PH domain-containing protein [Campylobacter sp. RM6913]MBE3028842.1 PH domain-containing protein [Campylobacter sp. RM9344]MBE3607200.1 PH domain-containing protein [Campylobacter sp. RM9337]MBE3609500.1 PH domain-containing protein [Campylobacter sp. RM12916]